MKDIFISHASEDKNELVRELAIELKKNGYSVWYDEFELSVGDSLSECIDEGLSISEFGIVILSKHFFNKEWPKRELRGLVSKEIYKGKTILPIWHNIDYNEVFKYSTILADSLAIKSEIGIPNIIKELKKVIGHKNNKSEIELAEQYFQNGNYIQSIVSSAIYLEKNIQDILIDQLGYKYFKKTPLRSLGLRRMFEKGIEKKVLKTKKYNKPEIDIVRLSNTRNKVIHGEIIPDYKLALWFLEEVKLFQLYNNLK